MDEKNTGNEKKEIQETPADTGTGVQSEATTDLDRADEIVERRNRVCDREEAILKRKETLAARQAVGGVAEAGQTPVKKSEDEKWAEGAKERYAGTGLDPTDDNTPTTYS